GGTAQQHGTRSKLTDAEREQRIACSAASFEPEPPRQTPWCRDLNETKPDAENAEAKSEFSAVHRHLPFRKDKLERADARSCDFYAFRHICTGFHAGCERGVSGGRGAAPEFG